MRICNNSGFSFQIALSGSVNITKILAPWERITERELTDGAIPAYCLFKAMQNGSLISEKFLETENAYIGLVHSRNGTKIWVHWDGPCSQDAGIESNLEITRRVANAILRCQRGDVGRFYQLNHPDFDHSCMLEVVFKYCDDLGVRYKRIVSAYKEILGLPETLPL